MKKTIAQNCKSVIIFSSGASASYFMHKKLDKYTGVTNEQNQSDNEFKESMDNLNNKMDNLNNKMDNVDNKVDNLNNSINNLNNNNNDTSNFLPDINFDFPNISLNSLYEYFDTLDLSQVLNILEISNYTLILICLIEIVSIYFGNELIKYFNLENRFPKLALFFKIRAKLQKYVLIWNFFIIFALCLIGISFNIFLFLYP